jgi:hypothetical protein
MSDAFFKLGLQCVFLRQDQLQILISIPSNQLWTKNIPISKFNNKI